MSKEHKTKDDEIGEILDARRYMKRMQSELDDRLDGLKERVDELSERAREHISDQPLVVLGTVFVLGLALGVVLSEIKS